MRTLRQWLPATALVCYVLLLAGPNLVTGQGLSATNEQLGANAAATATEFETFEDLLSLSTTGGRGRGGRSGSGNLGSSFREARDFEQLQTSMYYISGSPPVYNSFNTSQTPDSLNYVPYPREQGACNSCVGQAAAAAIQMSLAYTTRQSVDNFNVSARALYYCMPGGRTCKTGWDIPTSLRAVEVTPQWLLPSKCFDAALQANAAGSAEPDINDYGAVCRGTAAASRDPECAAISAQQPRYSCSVKSLSSFWQLQQHIRTHGSVITRIAVYNDFSVQFNSSAKDQMSLQLPPYSANITAQLQYGHAAVIVGYDNTNFTWTILNSWGSGLDPTNPRKTGGITADGMFRIRMGVAGVGTPDLTYGVECEPAPGAVDNLFAHQPWLRKTRLPLTPVGKAEPGCYRYTMAVNDTFASVADHFDVDIRALVKSNLALFKVNANMTYKYQTTLKLDEMQQTLDVVQKVTQDMLGTPAAPLAGGGAAAPYFICSYFDAAGKGTTVKCDKATLASNPTICTRLGTVACTLFYSDVNVTQPAPGSRIKLCKPSWSDTREFNKVAFEVGTGVYKAIPETQEVAVRRVLQVLDPRMIDAEASRYISCSAVEPQTDWALRQTRTTRAGIRFSLALGCTNNDAGGDVNGLYFRVLGGPNGVTPRMHPNFSEQLVLALLDLPLLGWLYIHVYGGQVYPQLGALNLWWFQVHHYCMVGTLPPNLLYGWHELSVLKLTRQGDALDYNDPAIGICGISGPIPQQWQNTTRPDVANSSLSGLLNDIDLSGNLLSGSLPEIIGGNDFIYTINWLRLQHNMFTGRVPDAWARLVPLDQNNNLRSMFIIDIRQNQLAGPLPVSLGNLNGRLEFLSLDSNPQLSGCVPLSPYTTATFAGTQVAGRCASGSARDAMHHQQRNAMNVFFVALVGVNVTSEFRFMLRSVVTEIFNTLGSSVQAGQTSKTFQQNNPQGEQRGFCKVSVTLIDGIEYITAIEMGTTDYIYPGGGLNLRWLLPLVRKLPRLQTFDCGNCHCATALRNRLPPTLPSAAPNLSKLALINCNLIGPVPATYGNWPSMEQLILTQNYLSGRLPPELAKLKNLKVLTLQYNDIISTLPSAWSALPAELYVGIALNPGITGTIPASWASNTGTYFDLYATSVGGCVPRGLTGTFDTFRMLSNGTRVLRSLPVCANG